jgi:aminopeptidase
LRRKWSIACWRRQGVEPAGRFAYLWSTPDAAEGFVMTAHQRHISTPIDPTKLDRLAEVAVKVGLQLQAGQDLLVTAPTVALPLVRRIAEHAYKAGAGLVTPIFSDEAITLSRYRFGSDGSFDRAASWL